MNHMQSTARKIELHDEWLEEKKRVEFGYGC